MEFQLGSPSIYYRNSNVIHGVGGDIFWNSPVQHTIYYLPRVMNFKSSVSFGFRRGTKAEPKDESAGD